MKISKDIQIIYTNLVATPSLFGVISPKILLPTNISNMSEENLEYVIIHELSHYKRKDILVNYILLVLQAVYWFNPIVWICFKIIRNDMEIATDEYALCYIEDSKHKSYAGALLQTIENAGSMKLAPKLLGMADDKKNISRRIKMIKSLEIFKRKRVIISIIALVIIIACAVVFLTLPKYSSEPTDNFDISTYAGSNRASRGGYKWKYGKNEAIGDSSSPYDLARSTKLGLSFPGEEIVITPTTMKNIASISIYDVTNRDKLSDDNKMEISKRSKDWLYIAPNTNGTYYYALIVEYENGSRVEYAFSIEIKEKEVSSDSVDKIITKYNNKYLGDNSATVQLNYEVNEINPIQFRKNDVKYEILGNEKKLITNYYVNADLLPDVEVLNDWNMINATYMIKLLQNLNIVVTNIYDENNLLVYTKQVSISDIKKRYNKKIDELDLFNDVVLSKAIYST